GPRRSCWRHLDVAVTDPVRGIDIPRNVPGRCTERPVVVAEDQPLWKCERGALVENRLNDLEAASEIPLRSFQVPGIQHDLYALDLIIPADRVEDGKGFGLKRRIPASDRQRGVDVVPGVELDRCADPACGTGFALTGYRQGLNGVLAGSVGHEAPIKKPARGGLEDDRGCLAIDEINPQTETCGGISGATCPAQLTTN